MALLVLLAVVIVVLPTLVVLALMLIVSAFNMLVFRNIDKLSKRLNPTSLIISEVVFGILLTALAVELVVSGLAAFGIIEPIAHH